MPTREEWLTNNIPNPYSVPEPREVTTSIFGANFGNSPYGVILNKMGNNAPTNTTTVYGDYTADDIPVVSDPEAYYAKVTRDEFLRQKNQYGQFTRDAVSTALTDTSLIDQAREDAPKLAALSKGIVDRNRERYGVDVNPAQAQARVNETNRASVLAETGGVNNARINQLDQNRTSIARLMAVSSNSYQDALGGLGTAAANAASRTQAYKSAKADAKSQRINGVGTAVAAGIIMF